MITAQKHVHWGLLRRIGFGLIILAISGLLIYYFVIPMNVNPDTINPRESPAEQNYLLLQRNQFLTLQGTCINCQQSVGFNITIYQLQGENTLENTTINQIYLNFTSMAEKTISLGPANYIIAINLVGNHTATLVMTGYGVPYNFIATQGVVIFLGVIAIILDKKFT